MGWLPVVASSLPSGTPCHLAPPLVMLTVPVRRCHGWKVKDNHSVSSEVPPAGPPFCSVTEYQLRSLLTRVKDPLPKKKLAGVVPCQCGKVYAGEKQWLISTMAGRCYLTQSTLFNHFTDNHMSVPFTFVCLGASCNTEHRWKTASCTRTRCNDWISNSSCTLVLKPSGLNLKTLSWNNWRFSCRQLEHKKTYLADVSIRCSNPQGEMKLN